MLDHLMLRFVGARGIDPARWPGRGLDGPLYDTEDWVGGERRLAHMSRPELERAIAAGRTTAVLPLGSTEQHGPHLPFATDTRIADALADRFCASVREAIRLPALAIGCSSEHLGFPGTLTISPQTLAAVLRDVLEPLASCGFEKVFVFSAHGGNFDALARALPELRKIAAPLEVVAFTDLGGLTATLQREAAAHGISAEVSGHHAGETETSIMLALDRTSVRAATLAAGFVEPTADPQSLFYPRLRARAPAGTVGDPSAADAARGERYLELWTGLLTTAYRGEKNDR
jgi:creatinine amidohydrolase